MIKICKNIINKNKYRIFYLINIKRKLKNVVAKQKKIFT